jgi:hypothetical protein
MISEAPECGQARTSSRGIVTKSAPPPTNRVCLYCGLQSAATSHGSVADCVDALQREVARLRDHLHQGKPSGPVIFSTCIGSGQCRSDGDSAPSRWLIPRTWCCGGGDAGPSFTVGGSRSPQLRAEGPFRLSLEQRRDDLAKQEPAARPPECPVKNISPATQRVRWWPGVHKARLRPRGTPCGLTKEC